MLIGQGDEDVGLNDERVGRDDNVGVAALLEGRVVVDPGPMAGRRRTR